ncbi:MAG: sigma-70 family RNA polymerase sigma factor [Pseudomonadota bacterium]
MARLGDSYALFERIVTAEMRSLYGTALRLTRNPSEAEDLVAETVARAWAAQDSLKDPKKARPWLFRIMTNSYISDYRKRGASPEIEAQICGDDGVEDFSLFERLHQPFLLWWGNPEQEFVNKLLREDIAAAIDALSDDFRLVVMLVDVEGFSYLDAAEALDIPVNTVRSRLKRARGCLQKALWRHAGELGVGPENVETETRKAVPEL